MSEPELVFVADLLHLMAEREQGLHHPFDHDSTKDERACRRCRLHKRLRKLGAEYDDMAGVKRDAGRRDTG